MAFSNALTSRLDDLRSRNAQIMGGETTSGFSTPSRYSGSFMSTHSQPVNDARGNLQRRFTTDLTKMPTLPPIGQPPNQVVESVDLSSSVSEPISMRL